MFAEMPHFNYHAIFEYKNDTTSPVTVESAGNNALNEEEDVYTASDQDNEEKDAKKQKKRRKETKRRKKKKKKRNKRQRRRESHDESQFYCNCCDKTFANESSLRQHKRFKQNQGNSSKYTCDECAKIGQDKSFGKSTSLKEHKAEYHQDPAYIKYRCCYCDKGFYNNSHFQKHVALGESKGHCDRAWKYNKKK